MWEDIYSAMGDLGDFGKNITPPDPDKEKKAKIAEIGKEPRLDQPEIRKRARDFATEIQGIADETSQYMNEHFLAEQRYRENGLQPQHIYTITLGNHRYRIVSTTGEGEWRTQNVALLRREIDPHLTDEEHRDYEGNRDVWPFKAMIQAAPKDSKNSSASIKYEGSDPDGDNSLGLLILQDTQRASVGIEKMMGEFREHSISANQGKLNL